MSNRANDPIHPSQPLNSAGMPTHEAHDGMTLREHFAGLAMQGMISSDVVMKLSDSVLTANPEATRGGWVASQAVGFADALLAELAKDSQP